MWCGRTNSLRSKGCCEEPRHSTANGFVSGSGKPPTVRRFTWHGGNIDSDFVQMPHFEAFGDAERYYASLANERTD
jgi:hypothetical protein